MNKKFIFILIIFILGIGMFFLVKNIFNGTFYNEISSENSNNFTWDMTTIFFKDFKAIMNADWQAFENSSSTYSVITYIPQEISTEDINSEFISISVSFLGEDSSYDLDSLLEQGVQKSKIVMPDFELNENVEWKNDYFSGKKIKFSGTSEEVKKYFTQVFGIKFNQLYVITYSCPEENCSSYEVYDYLIKTFEPVNSSNTNRR